MYCRIAVGQGWHKRKGLVSESTFESVVLTHSGGLYRDSIEPMLFLSRTSSRSGLPDATSPLQRTRVPQAFKSLSERSRYEIHREDSSAADRQRALLKPGCKRPERSRDGQDGLVSKTFEGPESSSWHLSRYVRRNSSTGRSMLRIQIVGFLPGCAILPCNKLLGVGVTD